MDRVLHTATRSRSGPVPTEVRAIDLHKLAALINCSVDDLAIGVRNATNTPSAGSQVAAPSECVTFAAQETVHFTAPDPPGITIALLSLASRPGVLDSADTPKCLIQLGSQPVIGHVLTQLFAGGIRRIVIVLGAHGHILRPAILALPIASRLHISFSDLGHMYNGGFARSLLAAAASIGTDPFLLATSDHIFHAEIVRDMRTALVANSSLLAVALVEMDGRSREASLPPTAVRVIFDESSRLVSRIGRQVQRPSGIEAGLYACTASVFASLTSLLAKQAYFTVSQAMQLLAADARLGAALTNGRAWFAIETQSQFDSTVRDTLHAGREAFPWQVSIARAE